MSIDGDKLGKDLGFDRAVEIHSNLCRSQLAKFEDAIAIGPDEKTIVTCTQELPMFQELADQSGKSELTFVNIRETAGWGKSGGKASAKIAALIADAAYEVEPTGLIPVVSNGVCTIYGAGQQAMDIASKLSKHLSMVLVLTNATDVLVPGSTDFPVYLSSISKASGTIGKFEVTIENQAVLKPSSKSHLEFQNSENGAHVECDLIFDLSGGNPLLGGSHGRDGYYCLDPDDPMKLYDAMFEIVDMVGEFEKPIFVSYDSSICAHGRNGKTGCGNCIDNCPTSAITSEGESVLVNKEICDGCGHCSSGCPTGAISYLYPGRLDLVRRSQILLSTYLGAGGKNPVLLVHETAHGGELISAMARYGDGLPDNILPLAVHSATHIGHDALTAFFTAGVQNVIVLAPLKKRDDLASLNFQIDLTNTFLRAMKIEESVRIQLVNEDDPDIVSSILEDIPNATMLAPNNFIPGKNKRENGRLALANLVAMAPYSPKAIELPENSPYGEISIDGDKCTLCLACVGACPAGALADNEDRPQVSFTEYACLQCGLCRNSCPEKAISLKARYNFDNSAMVPVVLNSEEPLECTECGKPFGSRPAIEKVIDILQGNNPMFQTSKQLAMLKMCETCRVMEMAKLRDDPMKLGTVPRVMTADDISPEDEEPTRH
ncbi:MAG: 4Fe-4S dicluster domain-containing protein [Hyphomicrobiales bacterium]|nr:4Fe-4S dicluster domain-containing protein [Hyphomicrobiales bacterium]